MKRLHFGDNLKWPHERLQFSDASVDLVYLDPLFNSNQDHNVLLNEQSGEPTQVQIEAFTIATVRML